MSPAAWEHWRTSLAMHTDSRLRVLGPSRRCGVSASCQMTLAALQRWSLGTQALVCRSTGSAHDFPAATTLHALCSLLSAATDEGLLGT